MFWWKSGPKVNKRVERLLREAEHMLLDAHRAHEDAEGHVRILEKRVGRLRAMQGQHAPTQSLDGVTSGDITQIDKIINLQNTAHKHG